MDTAAAVATLLDLTQTLINLSQQAQQVSGIIQKAQTEGRTTLTPEEWAVITGADDAARAQLVAALQKALAPAPAPK